LRRATRLMHFFDFFDYIRIINLPERTDRRNEVIRELQRIGLPLEKGRVEIVSATRPQTADGFSTIGARGCFLSHLQVLRQAQKDKARYLAVLEDDITFNSRLWNQNGPSSTAVSDGKWDLIWLGHLEPDTNRELVFERHTRDLLTTHFYAVNGEILGRLVDAFEAMLTRPAGHPDGGPMYPDGAFNTICKQNPDIVRLIALPSLAGQRSSRSDVTPRGWASTLPVVQTIADRCRAARNRMKNIFAH
jgi:glycosyl transferase family 25